MLVHSTRKHSRQEQRAAAHEGDQLTRKVEDRSLRSKQRLRAIATHPQQRSHRIGSENAQRAREQQEQQRSDRWRFAGSRQARGKARAQSPASAQRGTHPRQGHSIGGQHPAPCQRREDFATIALGSDHRQRVNGVSGTLRPCPRCADCGSASRERERDREAHFFHSVHPRCFCESLQRAARHARSRRVRSRLACGIDARRCAVEAPAHRRRA